MDQKVSRSLQKGVVEGLMLSLIVMSTLLYYDAAVNVTPYLSILPAECPVRIDIVDRSNIVFNGFAWYSGRIIIYDRNLVSDHEKMFVLAHELGHACSPLTGSYGYRESVANDYAEKLLQKLNV